MGFLSDAWDFITNPFDIFGSEAEQSMSSAQGYLYSSAQQGIAQQEQQRERIKEMYEPFYRPAVESALPTLQAMAEGGEVDFEPSKLYQYSKERGTRDIKRRQASKGQLYSSATEEKLADLDLNLASGDVDRMYGGQLSRLQIGTGAADAVSAASRSLSGNVSSIYTGLGGDLARTHERYGGARQSAYEGLSSTLMGIAQYMEA